MNAVVSRPRPTLMLAAALVLEAAVLLWPATLGGEVFFRRDVHLMWTAQAEGYTRAWREGAWPLWNPLVSFGQPLLADANNQVLYPPTLMHLVVRPWTYYTLYAFGHLALAGLGAMFLARRLGLARLPAWAAGALWMASGPLLSLIDTWNQLAGAAWMPWAIASGLSALACAASAQRRRALRWALGWAVCTALQVLAGAPETILLSTVALVALAIVPLRRDHLRVRPLGTIALGTVLASVIALGLAAGQWVTALDAARRAGRTQLPREARTHWSVHPLNLVQAVCPVPLHRLPIAADARQRIFGAPDPFLPSIYLGALAASLAAAALAGGRRVTWSLAVTGLLAALVALGRHFVLYDALVALVPPLQAFRYPAKVLLLSSLCWCLLCGFGLAALREERTRRWAAAAVAAVLGLLAALAAWASLGHLVRLDALLVDPDGAALQRGALRLGLAAVLAIAGAICLLRRSVPAGLLAGLALIDLALAHHDLNPTAPAAFYLHTPPAADAARDVNGGRLYTYDYQDPGASQRLLGRAAPYLLSRAPEGWDIRAAQALALRESLFPPAPALWGTEGSYDRDVPGLEPAPLALLKEAFRQLPSDEARGRFFRLAAVSRVAALHAGAGVGLLPVGRYDGYFVDPVRVFAVPHALARTYVVGGGRVAADDATALRALLSADFDPGRDVVLSAGAGRIAPPDFAGISRVRERRADRVVIEAETSAPGWVVLVDAWDPGWRVRVDGQPAPLERANVGFRAVAVPAGRHQVEMTFRPARLALALWASGASLAAVLIGVWVTRRGA